MQTVAQNQTDFDTSRTRARSTPPHAGAMDLIEAADTEEIEVHYALQRYQVSYWVSN